MERMCSNALAMIKNMTDTDIANYEAKMGISTNNRNLNEILNNNDDAIQWPDWISTGDRRLLQSSTVNPDVVVAADGSGNFKTVSAAVAAAPEKSSKRYVIRIKAGVYRENVEVPKKKTNIMFMGDGRRNTIITGSRNVVDGSTTFNSATVGKFIFTVSVFIISLVKLIRTLLTIIFRQNFEELLIGPPYTHVIQSVFWHFVLKKTKHYYIQIIIKLIVRFNFTVLTTFIIKILKNIFSYFFYNF